ncbi:MAG: dihydroorotase family protein [bacterium]|nr:dihydroorotase family protein [bacterium]MDE0290452.1 dihydroorotase family protein [bacterium]MDE0437786.1 dihydroorotase family protein [bacterium]
MARHDLLINGATIVNAWGRQVADVLVDGESISGIVKPGTGASARRTIDADGRVLLPGLVDTHCHHRDPGFTHKEDATTATRAAAAGGVTTTFAMPNVSPPPKDTATLASMIDHYRRVAVVDWNINAAATDPDQIEPLARMGIAGFKIYMVADTGRDYPHMPGLGVHDHGELLRIFRLVERTGLPLMVHVHDQSIMDVIEQSYWDRGERDYRAYARAYAEHDGIVWEAALAVVLRIQQSIGTRLHVLHTQTEGMVDQIRAAKAQGRDVTSEINPWALFLGNDWDTVERLGSYALSFWVPPKHADSLWGGMRDGTIDLVATDHAPHLAEEKEPGWEDGWAAHTGTPSLEFYGPLLLDAARSGLMTLEDVVRLTSTRPAEVFGLRRKGRIEAGRDADLVLVDPDRSWVISDDRVHSKCGWTPYAGRRVVGAIDTTILRGQVVYDDGEVTAEPGSGRMATPS